MKLIIQIPCFNEEETLAETVADLPTSIEGIDVIELLVIDDGSTDRTVEVAKAAGVHHIVRHDRNRGLAAAYMTGLEASVRAGANVIVNTDADNQYVGADIAVLVAPVLSGEADLVIGTRPIASIRTFSPIKRMLQRVGSRAVRVLSGTDVQDATSGFRAIGRETALQIQVHGTYTYTLETIIQAGAEGLKLKAVPIRVNPQSRPSRLVRSSFDYVRRQLPTILRSYARYRPMRFFTFLSLVPGLIGIGLFARWFILHATGDEASRVPSLLGGAVLMLLAVQFLVLGILADILAANRRIGSQTLTGLRRWGWQPDSPWDGSERRSQSTAHDAPSARRPT